MKLIDLQVAVGTQLNVSQMEQAAAHYVSMLQDMRFKRLEEVSREVESRVTPTKESELGHVKRRDPRGRSKGYVVRINPKTGRPEVDLLI